MKYIGHAPVRISLCNGGDTDYYIKAMGWGNLISATIDNLGYTCEVTPKSTRDITYIYENTFNKKKIIKTIHSLDDSDDRMRLILATLKEIHPRFKGEIGIKTNVPEKSGLGGSSTLIVSLIKALQQSKNEVLTPEEIAKKAYYIERIVLEIKGGYQDQWASAFGGGVNYMEFRKGNVFIEPLWLDEKLMQYLEKYIILFYFEPRVGNSGQTHEKLEKNLKRKRKETTNIMLSRRDNVLKTRECLLSGRMSDFVKLLNEEQRKKELLNSNTITIKSKELYKTAILTGAVAGKISGTGEGGCAFFICPLLKQKAVVQALQQKGAVHLPLRLERLDKMGV